MKALLDTGAGEKFIDQNFVQNQKIKIKNLEHPIEVFNVDGTPNKWGTITKYTRLDLTINRHTQPHNLFVTGLGKQKIILGYPWFKQNNPEIDWEECTCQGFTGRTPAWVQDGSLPKGLTESPAQSPRLGQLRTRVGSKSLVMQDCWRLPWLITAPDYFGNPRREMSQVATWTFNVLYYFPFIWFNGSHYSRSYI